MCEANVYLIDREGRERLLLESVDKIIPGEEGIFLENIFSQRKIMQHLLLKKELTNKK